MPGPENRIAPAELLIAVVLIATRLLAWSTLPIYDDAFITFRYARNLAEGIGFFYNAGEAVLGTTTPAYGVILSPLYALGLPMPESAILLNILFDLGTLLLVLRTFRGSITTEGGMIFGMLFAVSPIMARVCVGGMEMSLFLLCSVGAVALYHGGRRNMAVMTAALTCFLRPEGVILTGLLCLLEFLTVDRRSALKMAGIAIVTAAPVLAAIYLTYGQFVSQSVLAKSTLEKDSPFLVFWKLVSPDPLMITALFPAAYGALLLFRRGRRREPVRDENARQGMFGRPNPAVTVALWTGLYILAYCIGRPKVWSWYGEAIYFGVLLLAAVGIADIVVRLIRPEATRRKLLLAGCAAPLLVWGAIAYRQGPSDVRANVYEPFRRWSAEHLSREDTIMAYDIGALGYYSGSYIYDFAGLVTPGAESGKSLFETARSIRPDYLFLFMTRSNIAGFLRSPAAATYMPLARFSLTGETDLSLDTNTLQETWLQDYIIFGRREEEGGPPSEEKILLLPEATSRPNDTTETTTDTAERAP